jgi:hypothetical protein
MTATQWKCHNCIIVGQVHNMASTVLIICTLVYLFQIRRNNLQKKIQVVVLVGMTCHILGLTLCIGRSNKAQQRYVKTSWTYLC